MKIYIIFYLLTAFTLGGALVYITLDYPKQSLTMVGIGVLSLIIARIFKLNSK